MPRDRPRDRDRSWHVSGEGRYSTTSGRDSYVEHHHGESLTDVIERLSRDKHETIRQRDELVEELRLADERNDASEAQIDQMQATIASLRSELRLSPTACAILVAVALIAGFFGHTLFSHDRAPITRTPIAARSGFAQSDARSPSATQTPTSTSPPSPKSVPSAVNNIPPLVLSPLACNGKKTVARLGVFRGTGASVQAVVSQQIVQSREGWRYVKHPVPVRITTIAAACTGAVIGVDGPGLIMWSGPFKSPDQASAFCDQMGWRTDQHPDCYPLTLSR